MTEERQRALDTALAYIKRVQSHLIPVLTEQHYIEDEFFSVQSAENDPNPSYRFDEISNQMLFDTLNEHRLNCHVYSEEEHSWKTVGDNPEYYVICDPFCNSFLASHTFRDAAVAVCISDLEGHLSACAIGDLQIRRIYFADSFGAYVLESHKEREVISQIHVSKTNTVENAFIVTPLLKSSRRRSVNSYSFFQDAKIVHGVDGAIMIGRLAAGHIDAYLDPIKGQPLYEVPCYELITRAGGIVTDDAGRPFSLSEVISGLTKNNGARYKFVAAGTESLHKLLLQEFN